MIQETIFAPIWLTQVHFRIAKREDLPALEWGGDYAHFRRLFREVYEASRQGKSIMWVVDLPGPGIIGQLFVQLSSARSELADGATRAYLYSFRVKPAYRNHGIGARLLQVVEADLVKRRFQWVTLNVGRDNPRARRFYEKHGYQMVAAEPGRWSYLDEEDRRHEVYEPAWRMEKNLAQSRLS